MAYNCQYSVDRGVKCNIWTRSDDVYCDVHQKAIDKIDELEREIREIIRRAREKKP